MKQLNEQELTSINGGFSWKKFFRKATHVGVLVVGTAILGRFGSKGNH